MSRPKARAFPAPDHNHGTCESALQQRAERLFTAKGMKMTELRQRVLSEISASHEALGAYEILERLATKGPRLAPVSVYRAIEALHEVGLVHRLESRNAYFACHTAHPPDHDQVVLACDRCGRVAEIDGIKVFQALQSTLQQADFLARRTVTEISGTCAACRDGRQ